MAIDVGTLEAQIKCVRRELALRRNAYPRWVKSGRMKEAEAVREIETMEAVLETLQTVVGALKITLDKGLLEGSGEPATGSVLKGE